MAKPIEQWQIIRMHVLMNKCNLLAYKIDIIDTYNSDGRYIYSSKELYYEEANNIINYLNGQLQLAPEFRSMDQMRKKVIGCCRQMGWEKANKADMARINAWVSKYGHAKKEFMKYDLKELVTLVTQAENMRDSYLTTMRTEK